MKLLSLLTLLGLASIGASRGTLQHVGRRDYPDTPLQALRKRQAGPRLDKRDSDQVIQPEEKHHKRAGPTIVPQNKNTTKYAVDGTGLPDVHFDIGESYAGLMPISAAANETRKLYFWYFPSKNPDATDEITIWLNGGPGCSSLEGLLQENGPFLWQYGTYQPIKNPYTWVNLTNVLWVEQPVGTGFSQGKPQAQNEDEVGADFVGFFRQFSETFGIKNRKVYITGESYAGQYIPYIAHAFFAENNTEYFGVEGTLMYDPVLTYQQIQTDIPAVPFLTGKHSIMPLNQSYLNTLNSLDVSCGYAAFREKALQFPPKGPIPLPPQVGRGCDVYDGIFNAAIYVNPCYDIYAVATTCPLLWDVLGFPGSIPYSPVGSGPIYFDRPDVQKAINAPLITWNECTNGILLHDDSTPTALSVLPGVIEKSKRTLIGHGLLDMVLIANGTLMAIQNMTWNGMQGLQAYPDTEYTVPNHIDYQLGTVAGAGMFGRYGTERGLTYFTTELSGHMQPQYAPSASYRHVEFLLGRIPTLEYPGGFTTK